MNTTDINTTRQPRPITTCPPGNEAGPAYLRGIPTSVWRSALRRCELPNG